MIEYFKDFRKALDKVSNDYQKHLDDKKMFNDYEKVLNEFNPKFWQSKYDLAIEEKVSETAQQQNKLANKMKFKKSSGKQLQINLDFNKIYKFATNKGGVSDTKRIEKYHKRMVKRFEGLKDEFEKIDG